MWRPRLVAVICCLASLGYEAVIRGQPAPPRSPPAPPPPRRRPLERTKPCVLEEVSTAVCADTVAPPDPPPRHRSAVGSLSVRELKLRRGCICSRAVRRTIASKHEAAACFHSIAPDASVRMRTTWIRRLNSGGTRQEVALDAVGFELLPLSGRTSGCALPPRESAPSGYERLKACLVKSLTGTVIDRGARAVKQQAAFPAVVDLTLTHWLPRSGVAVPAPLRQKKPRRRHQTGQR